jgi:chemotaxis response regulator CheB
MTRVVVVADSGSVMAELTNAVSAIPGAHIVRHGSSRTRLDRLVARVDPDLVVIGELEAPEKAPARVAEIHEGAPRARVVVLQRRDGAGLRAALHATSDELGEARRRRRARQMDTTHGGAAA